MKLKEIVEAIKSVKAEAKRKGLSAKEIDDLYVELGSYCDDCDHYTACTSFEAYFRGEGAGYYSNDVEITIS